MTYLQYFGLDFTHHLPLILLVENCTPVWPGVRWQVDARGVWLGHEVTVVAKRGEGSLEQWEMIHLEKSKGKEGICPVRFCMVMTLLYIFK